ncbi:glycosyltransferase family 2 protein [Campylobacter ureolyticus]|uniref:Glycosyltransferase family 2 protein n=1 Tax=Campylobacter ureolyticus TaxID=827 RepID=A0A2I1NBG1_9BACT|nr:glycosyltransferase family 2 protein [Campylobacter ureolyticus]PKZ29709.1 glycosyltransferase family 2 protein [Campylobacter ureolyticus]
MNNPLVSVIVPVYNVENFIEKCATTLFEQDYDNIEYIFVNDCTPDSSISVLKEIIKKYPNRKNSIKIINKEKNKGLFKARQTGLKNANGEYIIHIDSDDWVEYDMISLSIAKLLLENSDIVIFDFYEELKNCSRIKSFNIPNNKFDLLNSFTVKSGYMNYVWNKLVKKDLYDEIVFDDYKINMYEDLYVVFKLCFNAKRISILNKPLHHYNRKNTQSITNSYKIDYFYDRVKVVDSIISFLKNNNAEKEYKDLINFYKLYSKLVLILYPNIRNKKLWQDTYPEANEYIWKTNLKFPYKIISWLCKKHMFRLAYFIADLRNIKWLLGK